VGDVHDILTAVGEVVYEWTIADDRIAWGPNAGAVLGLPSVEPIATGRGYAAFKDPTNLTSRNDAVMNGTGADQGGGVAYEVQYALQPDGPGGERRLYIEDTGRWYAGANGRPERARVAAEPFGRVEPGRPRRRHDRAVGRELHDAPVAVPVAGLPADQRDEDRARVRIDVHALGRVDPFCDRPPGRDTRSRSGAGCGGRVGGRLLIRVRGTARSQGGGGEDRERQSIHVLHLQEGMQRGPVIPHVRICGRLRQTLAARAGRCDCRTLQRGPAGCAPMRTGD